MAVLFDLDGTLTDPGVGIVRSILYALDRLGAPTPAEDLGWCVGPPLAGSFTMILGTDEPSTIAEAIRLYRERFSNLGLYENRIYPGIVESLERLREEELPLLVATSKPHALARRVLDQFELSHLFDRVYGSELDGRPIAKGDLIAALMKAEGFSPGGTLMVGDREHDVLGARRNGIPCLGVTYGYGGEEELEDAGAADLCDRPERVAEAVLSLRARLALGCENHL